MKLDCTCILHSHLYSMGGCRGLGKLTFLTDFSLASTVSSRTPPGEVTAAEFNRRVRGDFDMDSEH